MNKQQFIKRYQEFLKKEKLTIDDAWIGAGGTLLLLGLKQETNDIDMGVSTELFNKFKKRNYKTHIFNGDTLVIEYNEYIDIHEENNANTIIIDGVNSWTIQEVLKLKQRLNRPKDQEDIKNILNYMKRNNISVEEMNTANSILKTW